MAHLFTFNPLISRLATLFLLLGIPFIANAQTGSLRGRIISSDGEPAAYVNIVLKEINKGTTSAEDGSYLIKNIKEGNYTVTTSFVGLQTKEQSVTITAGKTTELDITLFENAQQLTEVVVSGARSLNEQPVAIGKIAIKPMDLPQSITVIDRQIMDQQQVLRISDVLRNTNGVYVMGTTGGTQEELAARGFSFNSNNTFKNGVRFNNSAMPETSSLEKVEVLKGSNAILFGNVSAGGVLNLVTKKPKFERGGEVSLRVGSYQFYKPAVDVYGRIGNSQKVAYRLNTTYENAQSFRDEVKSERFYINPSLLIKLGNKTDVLLEGDYMKDNRTPDFGIGTINYTILDVPRSRYLGAAWSNYKVEQKTATATITHTFNSNWQLRAVGGYQNYNQNQYATSRPVGIRPDGTWVRNLQRSATNENYFLGQVDLTGQFNTGFLKHNLLFGADADQYRTDNPAFTIFADPTNPTKASAVYDSINVFNPSQFEQRSDIPQVSRARLTKNLTGRGGVYVQDLITITEQIKVLAGVRYSYIETRSEAYKDDKGTLVLDYNPSNNNQPVTTRFYDAFTPRFGLVYQPLKTTSVFASYANSFSPNTGIDNTGQPLPPSFLNQYEVGVKNDLFKGLLSANVTLYQIVNSNQPQTILQDSPNFNPAYPNAQELAGEITSKGFEVDIMTKSIHGFSFIGGYSYNNTRYTQSNIYEVGSRLRYNPGHTANASVYYAFSQNNWLKGFNIGLSGMYVADMVAGRSTRLTVPNDVYRLIPLPSFFQFDASLGYTINRLSVRGRITNVLNQLSYYAHDDNSINPIAPRQFAATVAYRF